MDATRPGYCCGEETVRAKEAEIIVAVPYWVLSGVRVFAANLVRGLIEEGSPARILLTEHDTDLVRIPEPTIPLPADLPVDRLAVARHEGWGAHWRAMIRYLERQAPCVYVPVSDWRHSCISPKLSNRVAIVGCLQSDDPLHYDHAARLGRYWNAIACCSDVVAAHTAALDPSLADRIVTIPNGVPVPERYPRCEQEPGAALRIVYHGVFNRRQKRILDLPQIVAALSQLDVPFELILAGDGPDRQLLLEACQPHIDQGIVRWLGFVPYQEIPAVLAQSDVYILTSAFEGMPHALLEAMGQGCVPVVTDVASGVPEIVRDGVNGYRVPIGQVRAFAERLARLQRDPELRRRMSLNAYQTASTEGYRIQDMAQRYQLLFQRILAQAQNGTYRRPSGSLLPPPQEVAGISILPGTYTRDVAETELALSWKGRLPKPLLAMGVSAKRLLRRRQSAAQRHRS